MTPSPETRTGVLEVHRDGHGYLRDPERGYRARPDDVYVTERLIERNRVRPGAKVLAGVGPPPPETDEPPRATEILEVEGLPPREADAIRRFEDLTAVDPSRPIVMETGPEPLTMRVLDLLTPIGRGQRGLIVAPPRTGKTILLQQIALAVERNDPDLRVVVLLVDERPEEVTEMRRTVRAQVVASSNDQEPAEHIRIAQLAFDRARRDVEAGGHVLILLDSLTRLARAYNKFTSTGRTLTGGMDIRALDVPKRLFGSARACDQGGSLTVLGTCLVQTGSKADELVFQEFKGTGNLEIVLDRELANRRVWPALDLAQSGTRKEERLLGREKMAAIVALRRTLSEMDAREAVEKLLEQLAKAGSNGAFLERIAAARR